MKTVTYSIEDMNPVMDYLGQQPYREVAGLIHMLQTKQIVPKPKKKPKKKEESKKEPTGTEDNKGEARNE